MSIIDIVVEMPCWYLLLLIVFSLYYGIRAIVEQVALHGSDKTLGLTAKIIIFYIQEFLFKIIITISGFVALFIANYIFSEITSINDIGAGTGILLVFLIIWGITGISGYLTLLIARGKLSFGQ